MYALLGIRNAVQSIPGINRLSTRAKEAETEKTNTTIDLSLGLSSTPSSFSGAGLLYASAVKPITHLGLHVRWIMWHLHRNSLEVTETKEKHRSCTADLRFKVTAVGEIQDHLDLLDTDNRIENADSLALMDEWTTNMEAMLRGQTTEMNNLLLHNDTLKLGERLVQEGWKALYFHSQEYVNGCLDASFNEGWCLSYRSCKFLRQLARHAEKVHAKRKELIALQKSRRTLVSPESGPAQLYQNELQAKISALKMSLQFLEEGLKEREALFLAEHIAPLLEGDADQPRYNQEDPERQDLVSETSPRRTPDREDWEDPEQLTAWYLDVRARHQLLQEDYASEQHRVRAVEPEYFLAFSNATRESFDKFVGTRLAVLKRKVDELEAQRQEMRDRLESMNIMVPGSDRINKFRFGTQQNGAPTTAATPPPETLRSHSQSPRRSKPHSNSSSPSSGHKRRRRDASRRDARGDSKRARTSGSPRQRYNDDEMEAEEVVEAEEVGEDEDF